MRRNFEKTAETYQVKDIVATEMKQGKAKRVMDLNQMFADHPDDWHEVSRDKGWAK